MSAKRLRLAVILGVLSAIAGNSSSADTGTPLSGEAVDPALLESIAGQAPVVTDPCELYDAIMFAQATQVWIKQDLILRGWPRYQEVRETFRRELSLTRDLDRAPVAQLREEAAQLRTQFWQQEGPLSVEGYRKPYQARLLLEIAHEREPANLAVSDELVETIQTSHPLDCHDPGRSGRFESAEVTQDLRVLRTGNYGQVKREIEQGRPFTWEDFARVADFAQLWSAQDPQRAAEAFEWGLSQVGSSLKGSDYEAYAEKVLAEIRKGDGVGFGIYMRLRGHYPHDYLYTRRLPSFQGPDPEDKGLVRMLGIGEPAGISFGS